MSQGKEQQWQPRLFFHDLLAEIERFIAGNVRARVHIVGGRGTGKSFLLERLKLKNRRLISFRTTTFDDTLDNKLEEHPGALCLDDIDEAFGAGLHQLLRDLINFPYPIVITSTFRSDLAVLRASGAFENLAWSDDVDGWWSESTSQYQPFRIEPWEQGWSKSVSRLMSDVLPSHTDDERAGYTTLVLDLTGGHPLMLNEAFEELSQMPRTARPVERTSIEWRQEHARLEEQLFGSGIRKMRKFIAWLDLISPAAGEELRRLARGEDSTSNPRAATRRALLDSGLVFRTPEQKMVIAGEALRHFLAPDVAPPEPVVVRRQSEQSGEIRVSIANSTVTVPVRGAAWTLVETLQNSEHAIPIEQLKQRLNLKEGALRSAIQRIRNDFDEFGVSNVIENLWGEGYRLSAMPLLTARAFEQ